MKIEVEASEIRDGKIEKISLVTSGAIRAPFKILKTEEIKEQAVGVKERLAKIFGSTEEESKIAALYVRKSVARQWLPLIKSYGFVVSKESAELEGDIIILKQEGYDPEVDGSVIALNKDVAIQLNQVVKSFDPFPMSSSFEENVRAAAFFPGLHNAMESLAETVWNVLNGSDSPEDASEAVAKQVKAFGSHVNNLVTELPSVVFKMEHEALTKKFEGYNVSSTDSKITVTKDEETAMSKTAVIKETMAGDLDGLLENVEKDEAALAATDAAASAAVVKDDETTQVVTKSGDEGAPKTGGSPGSPVVESITDTGLVSLDEGGVPAGFRKEERVMKELVDGKIVEKFAHFFVNDETKEEIFAGFFTKDDESTKGNDEATVSADKYTPAEVKLFEAMGVMVKSMTGIKELIEKQGERIEAVEKTAGEAKDAADNTVVMSAADDLDESLATLSGHQSIHKAANGAANSGNTDIFKGLLPEIEGDAA